MISRYCTLHPDVTEASLSSVLRHVPSHFRWAGCDLFVCGPARRSLVVETNSCPSGQKSLPFPDGDELNGYGRLMRTAFSSLLPGGLQRQGEGGAGGEDALGGRSTPPAPSPPAPPPGALAVVYDKNEMEAAGYAGALAELSGERVFLAEFYLTDPDPPCRWSPSGHLFVRPSPAVAPDEWVPVRAALRYVTQKPWTRMPVVPATPLLNPLLPCLAGGRNKMLAAKAYDALNARLAAAGSALRLLTPATRGDVAKEDIPALVAAMGGCAVVKVPYGNAGQGVYTITCAAELEAFMEEKQGYDRYIVQQLVGGRRWGGWGGGGAAGATAAEAGAAGPAGAAVERAYHIGTVPNQRGRSYVFDLRMMVVADETGFKPCSMYARRAAAPLTETAPGSEEPSARGAGMRSHRSSVSSLDSAAALGYVGGSGGGGGGGGGSAAAAGAGAPASAKSTSMSWLQLGTNLSVLTGDLTWSTESERLIMADTRDFAMLGCAFGPVPRRCHAPPAARQSSPAPPPPLPLLTCSGNRRPHRRLCAVLPSGDRHRRPSGRAVASRWVL